MAEAIRTQGDGTESPTSSPTEALNKLTETPVPAHHDQNDKIGKLGREYLSKQSSSSSSILFNPTLSTSSSSGNFSYPPERLPIGKKFFLIPKLIKSESSGISLKNRNPRLILFEPYKACINPIIPFMKGENKVKMPKRRNNLNLNELVQHMNITKTSAMSENEQRLIAKVDSKSEDKFSELKKERDYFENQFKFQMQVNAELKGLLVHSLGEDLQSKVNVLTEDKMKIAEHLSSNTEQIEYLIGQSEVWRSKFLASSLMVEELAKWKASLTQKNSMLLASNKNLLELSSKIREMQIEMLQNLKFLTGHQLSLKSSNVLDLTAESLNISKFLVLNSGKIGLPEQGQMSNGLESLTEEEKQSLQAIQNSNDLLTTSDDAFKAVCNQAFQEYHRAKNQNSEEGFEIINNH